MSKSIKQLRIDLIILHDKIQELATNLGNLYQDYFRDFSNIIKRQLILATYQICTQKYPDNFLELSLSERYNLQNKVKNLDKFFQETFIDNLSSIELEEHFIIKDLYHQIFVSFSNNLNEENPEKINLENITNNQEELDLEKCLDPQELIKIQVEIEDYLEESLNQVSHKANKYLQEAKILPSKIPSKILEMALESEENTSIVSGAPNLLSLLIEREDKSDHNIDITPIVAICLRITEVEFQEPSLSLIRQKINNLLRELSIINDEYQKKRKKYSIALAESAWRSSWTEE